MPRQAATKVYANFTGGLVTEANKLSYPENAAVAIDNLDINEDGSVQRRAGVDFDGALTVEMPSVSSAIADTATTVNKWSVVNGNPDLNIAVVQVADRLDFYYIRDAELVSTTVAAASITMTPAVDSTVATAALVQQTPISIASGGGRLYIVGKYIDPLVLEFTDPATEWDTGTVTSTTLTLQIRDFGVAFEKNSPSFYEAATDTTYYSDGRERQDWMSGAHLYNLANQGWTSQQDSNDYTIEDIAWTISSNDPDGGSNEFDPAWYTYTRIGYFPTLQHSMHAYQNGGGSTVTKQIALNSYLLENDYVGTTEAPRGHFVKDAFNLERKAIGHTGAKVPADGVAFVSGLEYEETIAADYRPTTVAFYAGRVWYAGLEGIKFTNNLYYSQIIGDSPERAAKCYQAADPTAEIINELVATDGGVLGIEEAGKIYHIAPIGPSLVVVADNGVWVVSGDGEASSFRADSSSIRKVTDQGATSTGSIAFAKDVIYYWSTSSIVAILTGEAGGVVASDISSKAIKSLYRSVAGLARDAIYSVFDEGGSRILWFYEKDLGNSFSNLSGKAFNKVLYWDISLGAFGEYTLGTQVEILPVHAINANVYAERTITDEVISAGEVVTADGEDVSTTATSYVQDNSSIKLMTITGNAADGYSYRFSDFSDVDTFEDWGVDSPSYIEAGNDSMGDIIGKGKKAPLIQTHFNRTEDGFIISDLSGELELTSQSGCTASYAWDWATAPYANSFEAYKLLKNYTPEDFEDEYEYNREVISTRNRIRGRGTALGMRFDSQAGKDFQLLGYGIVVSNRGRP